MSLLALSGKKQLMRSVSFISIFGLLVHAEPPTASQNSIGSLVGFELSEAFALNRTGDALSSLADRARKPCRICNGDLDRTTLAKEDKEWLNKFLRRKGSSEFVIKKMRADGNCLFHALSYGLGRRQHNSAAVLRVEIAKFIYANPTLEVNGNATIEDWVQWEVGSTAKNYASKVAENGFWGGQIELAVCSHLKRVNVTVYEGRDRNFSQGVSFNFPGATKNIYLLYRGGKHYDALERRNSTLQKEKQNLILKSATAVAIPVILGKLLQRRRRSNAYGQFDFGAHHEAEFYKQFKVSPYQLIETERVNKNMMLRERWFDAVALIGIFVGSGIILVVRRFHRGIVTVNAELY